MAKFSVAIYESVRTEYEIEADTLEQAEEMAETRHTEQDTPEYQNYEVTSRTIVAEEKTQ